MAVILSLISTILTSPLLSAFGPAIGEFAVSIVAAVIMRNQNNADARARFLDLVQQMESDKSIPGGLHAQYAAQVATNAQKAADQYAKDQAAAKPQPPASK